MVHELVSAVREHCPKTLLIVKLTPNVTNITVIARAAVEAGADVLSLINTFLGMVIDTNSRKPILGNRTGGLSGPAIKPMAVHLVHRVYQEVARDVAVPIIGMGGISCAEDALEFIIAGASAVAVGTAAMVNPGCLAQIVQGIKQYLIRHNFQSVRELVATLA
jgi:dihydroorotate dehydrogenase (NAD+) catalytic subunit